MRDIIEKQGMRSCLGMGILFSILSAVTYGLNPIFAKLGYAAQLSGIEILQSRFLFAVMTLAIAGPFLEDGFYRFSKLLLIKSLFIGLIVLLPLNLLYVYALKDIPASMMSLITYVYPVIILLVNGIVFHKKIQASQIVSVALIVLACVCIFSDALRSRITLTVLAIGFLSTFMYAAYLLSLQQLAENVSAYKITFLTLLFASLGLCFFHNPVSVLSLNAEQLGVTFGYGVVSTVLSTIFVSKAIQMLGATQAGIFCSFEPVFTICFASLLLGEHIPAFRWAGMVLLVVAIIAPNRDKITEVLRPKTLQ